MPHPEIPAGARAMAEESRFAFGPLKDAIGDIDPGRTVVVTDPEVRRLHGRAFPPCPVLEVERGEASKSLSSAERLYGAFLDLGLDRGSTVLAIGGGSVTDLAGFAASTWMRGVDFGFVPTTLLSMVDASTGGKNGVDFRGIKNLVGTINRPRFVRFDVSLLFTLPDRDFASGMAEAIKHGVIQGEEHFAFLEGSCVPPAGRAQETGTMGDTAIPGPAEVPAAGSACAAAAGSAASAATAAAALGRGVLEGLVERSVAFKSGITRRDEREGGERRLLNLGHTIGHAVEAVTGIEHGEAVACGLASAFRLAVSRGEGDRAAMERVLALLAAWELPTSIAAAAALATARAAGRAGRPLAGGLAAAGAAGPVTDGPELRERIMQAMTVDKKRCGGDIAFALPRSIGDVAIVPIALSDLELFVRGAP
jgi:3-dehydroquinate synthase